jgi:hypothetical protein
MKTGTWYQFGMPNEAIYRWADWYDHPLPPPEVQRLGETHQGWGLFGFVALACAMTNCTVRYGFNIAHRDGIGTIDELIRDDRYVVRVGPAVPA